MMSSTKEEGTTPFQFVFFCVQNNNNNKMCIDSDLSEILTSWSSAAP